MGKGRRQEKRANSRDRPQGLLGRDWKGELKGWWTGVWCPQQSRWENMVYMGVTPSSLAFCEFSKFGWGIWWLVWVSLVRRCGESAGR